MAESMDVQKFDLHNLLYSVGEQDLLRKLMGQRLLRLETDSHLLVNVVCESGYALFAMPEEVWISSASYETVGYSWVKRAAIRTRPWDDALLPAIASCEGIIDNVSILRTAIVFSETSAADGDDVAPSDTRLTEQLEKLFGKFPAREFDWHLINPDALE